MTNEFVCLVKKPFPVTYMALHKTVNPGYNCTVKYLFSYEGFCLDACVSLSIHMCEWNGMKFSLIPFQYTSTHMD